LNNDLSIFLKSGFACLDQLKKLNPYVKIELVETNLASFESNDDLLEYLKKFNTVILTEVNDLALSIRVNTVCRENGIKFLASDVFGLFAYSFTDFGPRFDVMDADGEDYKSVFISSILINDKKDTSDSAEANEALIETIDQKPHNLEVNDMIRLSEIINDQVENDSVINALNENAFKVTRVLNSHTFQIELNASIVDSSAAKIYNLKCGLFKKVKKVEHVEFNSLSYEITKPSLLFSDLTENKFFNPYFAHISSTARQALPVNTTFEEFKAKVVENLEHFKAELTITNLAQILNKLTRVFYFSSRGRCFPPLAAIYGGIVGQEVLKSITNKFLPVKQWLYLDCSELFELDSFNAPIIEWSGIYESSVLRRNDRYDCLRLCFGGEKTLEKLFRTKLFMVGCGAIGCEMLKNYALLGKQNYIF
jgi:ubiquitin-activating enzyme E1-like protein 2